MRPSLAFALGLGLGLQVAGWLMYPRGPLMPVATAFLLLGVACLLYQRLRQPILGANKTSRVP